MRRTIMATVAATLAVLVEDGAKLVRKPSSLSAKIKMPTPEPGTYTYPQTGAISEPGHPEAFTLWVFVFNFPDLCDGQP